MTPVNLTVILPSGDAEDTTLAELQEISAFSLIRPFAILGPDLRCELVAGGERKDVGSLFDYLSLYPVQQLRILRVSLSGADVNKEHLEVLRDVRREVEEYIDKLEFGSLTVLPPGGLASPGAFVEWFDFNLLAVPRDEAGESNFPPKPYDEERQASIAAAAVAVAGGLWTWMDRAPDDVGHVQSDSMGARLTLMRLATRVVDAGDLTARSVAWALAPGGQRPAPSGTVRHGDPDQYVMLLTGALAPIGRASPIGLSLQPAPEFIPEGRDPKGWWQTIVLFFSEVSDELRHIPRQIVEQKVEALKRRLERAVENGTFGEDSKIRVQIAAPSRFDEIGDPAGLLARLQSIPGMTFGAFPNGSATWNRLGLIIHGACDGTDFPAELRHLEPEWDGARATLTDLSSVACADQEGFSIRGDELNALSGFADGPIHVDSYDALAVRGIDNLLEQMIDAARVEIPTEDHSNPREENAEGKGAPVEVATSQVVEEGVSEFSLETDNEVHNAANGETESYQVDEFVQLRTRLRQWRTARERTLLWRIADRLADDQEEAAAMLESTESELEDLISLLEAEAEETEQRRKKFLKRALLVILGLALAVAIALSGFVLLALLPAIIVGSICVLVVAGLLKSAYRTARDRVRDRHRRRDLLQRDDHLAAIRRHAASELHRLVGLYEQYQDWAPIYSSSLHQPWGQMDDLRVAPWRTTHGALSFVCGEPVITAEGEAKAALETAKLITKTGWLRDAYLQRRMDWVDWYRTFTGNLSGASDEPEGDSSVGAAPLWQPGKRDGRASKPIYSPRVHFRREYVAGERADGFRRDFVRNLRTAAEWDTREYLVDEVRCDVPGLTGRSIRAFTEPVVTWANVPSFNRYLTPRGLTSSISIRSVSGITDKSGVAVAESTELLELRPVTERSVAASFRLDLSSPLRIEETNLVLTPVEADEPAPSDRSMDHWRVEGDSNPDGIVEPHIDDDLE